MLPIQPSAEACNARRKIRQSDRQDLALPIAYQQSVQHKHQPCSRYCAVREVLSGGAAVVSAPVLLLSAGEVLAFSTWYKIVPVGRCLLASVWRAQFQALVFARAFAKANPSRLHLASELHEARLWQLQKGCRCRMTCLLVSDRSAVLKIGSSAPPYSFCSARDQAASNPSEGQRLNLLHSHFRSGTPASG